MSSSESDPEDAITKEELTQQAPAPPPGKIESLSQPGTTAKVRNACEQSLSFITDIVY